MKKKMNKNEYLIELSKKTTIVQLLKNIVINLY